MNMNDLVAWVDLETTGLDHKTGLPLEAGVLITDTDLQPVAHYGSIIQWGTLDWDKATDDYVREMHTKSGLREEYDAGLGDDVRTVEEKLRAFLDEHDALALPMAGSNVANFDRKWLAEFMPELNDAFHYRNIDVSSIKEACRVWNPDVYSKLPAKVEKHRAVPDCYDTLGEFRFYHDNFLWTTR